MNVLETLFSDIATAIREKNSESGTMKPAEFPDKIRAISTSNGTGLRYRTGKFNPSLTGNTITHNMGIIPDLILIFPGNSPVSMGTNSLLAAVGFSQGMLDSLDAKSAVYLPNGSKVEAAYPITSNTDDMKTLGLPRNTNFMNFQVGGGTYTYSTEIEFQWIAFGNLLSA